MRLWITRFAFVTLLAVAATAGAINVGTDIIVPAAARGAGAADSTWVTDLYIFNPGSDDAEVTVYWMVRNQANPSPTSEVFTVAAGATLVLDDVVLSNFSLDSGSGAFRVISDYPVMVNSRIFNLKNNVTFGQGFAGVPVGDAIAAGSSTDVVGLGHNAAFRTNVVLMDASGVASTVELSLRDVAGTEFASGTYDLLAYEPMLFSITDLDSALNFDDATLHADVTNGAALIVGSKVDNDQATGDPTTLEAWRSGGGAASVDGVYQVSAYDTDEYAGGGNMVIADGFVTEIIGTYINFDKDDDGDFFPDCPLIFGYGGIFADPDAVGDYVNGVEWTEIFPESGQITWTLTFSVSNNMSISGTLDAVGADFTVDGPTGDETGCNGTFPTLNFAGGKAE